MGGTRVCSSFSEILREAWDLRETYRRDTRYADCELFFRGEYCSYRTDGDSSLPSPAGNAIPGLFRPDEDGSYTLRDNEHIMLHEAMRRYPDFVNPGMPTMELLSRMEHYFLPTRLLNISEDLRLATAMAVIPMQIHKKNDKNGFIYVYAIRKSRIKYIDSDTATAIAAMARLSPDKIDFEGDLGYLAHEIRRERPGFAITDSLRNQLIADLQHLWCIKPLLTTDHIRAQSGCFILFGNGSHKQPLDPTYSHEDFNNPQAPSYGIEQIDVIHINGERKLHIRDELEMIGMAEYQYYTEFTKFAEVFKRQLTEKGGRHE